METPCIASLRRQDAEHLDAMLEVVADVQQAVGRQVNVRGTHDPLSQLDHTTHHTVSGEHLHGITSACLRGRFMQAGSLYLPCFDTVGWVT